ncbi:MAG: polyprenyl synthetase family protein, partial [Ruminococcus sp.]|nr:polyprenyl synthetase family protein [Ruminococcus sp.]
MSNFNDIMKKYIESTEKKLKDYNNYSHENRPQIKLIDAMNYSLSAGGKRIRPALVFAFCEALGGDMETASAPACAIEMMHTFSLIHDDLPAMDNDDFRRGKPSCHKAFGEALAVLAGDALAVLPFEIIADAPELTADQKVLIISVLANSVGRDGMIGGQVIDMLNEERDDIDEEELRNMYRCKTGQLIAVSCVMGAVCAEADNETICAAAEYG